MKNIIQLLISIFLWCSCEGILDDQIPVHHTVDGNVVTDETSAEVALTGTYSYLSGEFWEFDYLGPLSNLAGIFGYRNVSTIPVYDDAVLDNNFDYENRTLLNQWQGAYQMILSANWVIDRVEAVADSKFSGNRKKEIVAEARFLRFFGHYYVFRMFCKFYDIHSEEGLLYREEPVGVGNHMMARLNVADSYEKLLADLNDVIENGPEFTDAYHASRDAAKAFKAELLMMRGTEDDLTEVITLTEELIAKYPLAASLEELYRDGAASSEVIFARFQSQKDTWGTPRMKDFCYSNKYTLSEHLLFLLQGSGYFNWYQGETIVYDPQGNTSTYENTVVKMAPTGKSNEEIKATTKMLYMRAAELYLLQAEAVARKSGKVSEVRRLINDNLFSRAAHPWIADQSYTKEELLYEVYKAYLVELSLENGIEFPLSVRFTDIQTGMRCLISQKRNLTSEADMWKAIQPIPKEEVRVNNLMKQNEGYPTK
jgi:hypothetical protein